MVIRIRYTTSQRAKMQQIWICFRKYRKHAHQSYLWKLWVFPVCSCVTELRPLAWLALDGLLNLRGRSKLVMKQTSNDDNVLLHGGPSCSYSQIWESLHAWVRASKCLDSKMKAALLSCGFNSCLAFPACCGWLTGVSVITWTPVSVCLLPMGPRKYEEAAIL